MGEYFINTYLSEQQGGAIFEIIKAVAPFTIEMYNIKREYEWVRGTCTYIETCNWILQNRSSQ